MAPNKKFYELDDTDHILDTDLFVLGRGTADDGTLAVAGAVLKAFLGSGAFNGNRAVTRNTPGLVGVNTGATNISDFLDRLFFPAVAPSMTLSVNTPTREVGGDLNYTLTWSVTKGTNNITSIIVDGTTVTPTGSNQSGTKAGTNSTNEDGSYTKTMQASDGTNSGSASTVLRYLYRIFFGSTATQISSGTAVRALSNNVFSNVTNFTLNTGTANRFFNIAIPDGMSLVSVIDLDALNLDITSTFIQFDLQVNDAGGTPREYKLFRAEQAIPYATNHRFSVTIS